MIDHVDIMMLRADDLDLLMSAEGLFDFPPKLDQSRNFLSSDREFIWFAIKDDQPIGFVSASKILHPDKNPHLFVNELATHADHRRKGVATRLMQTVVDFGREKGLWPVWLAAEGDDEQAKAFYRSFSGHSERCVVVYEWE